MFPLMSEKEYSDEYFGRNCPVCRDRNIGPLNDPYVDVNCYQDMKCNLCEAIWTEVYKLAGYDNLSEGEVENG